MILTVKSPAILHCPPNNPWMLCDFSNEKWLIGLLLGCHILEYFFGWGERGLVIFNMRAGVL